MSEKVDRGEMNLFQKKCHLSPCCLSLRHSLFCAYILYAFVFFCVTICRYKHKRTIRDHFSEAVARFISYPQSGSSQYITYDPLRCAHVAQNPFIKGAQVTSENDATARDESALTYFDTAFIVLIILNLGLVASAHVMQAPSFKTLQLNTDIVMNALYSFELLARLIAYNSFFLYTSNNPFDFCVVLISDIFLIIDSATDIVLPGINIFRVARLLRAVKILHRVPRIRLLLKRLFATMSVAIFPCIMLLFWVFCFCLVGVQIFKNSGVVSSRLGFETFGAGYVTAFSVMTFEKWLDVLDGLISQNQATAIIFFIVFVGVGKYLGLNGITASVLMTFSLDDLEKQTAQKKSYIQKIEVQRKLASKSKQASFMSRRRSSVSQQLNHSTVARLGQLIAEHDAGTLPPARGQAGGNRTSFGSAADRKGSVSSPDDNRASIGSFSVELGRMPSNANALDLNRVANVIGLPFVKKADVSLQDKFCNAKHDVLYLLTPESSFRGLAVSIISSSTFAAVIFMSIFASVVLLLAPTPYQYNPITPTIIRTSDFVFQGVFILECFLKVVSTGFFGHLGYWTSPWNRLDFFIVIIGALDLILSALVSDVQVLRFVRVFRMIRPLRLLNRFETLQVCCADCCL
jgi:hypothetical protein